MRSLFVWLSLFFFLGCDTAGTPERRETRDPIGTHLELQIEPLVDLYFFVRAQAADVDATPQPGYEEAVDAARAIQDQMGSFGGWGPLDSHVFIVADPGEMVQRFSELAEPYERRGRTLSIRDDAVRLATALGERLPSFTAELWPAREAELNARISYLESAFIPKHREALAFMMDSLGIADPGLTIPMFLVTQTNPPGAMTYYLRGGKPVSVLDVTVGGTDDLLLETLLHEATHTLDRASKDSTSAFDTLRKLLVERGVAAGTDAYHDIPHTLMFVQAGETMRRLYNPEHVAYGDATDLYERSGNAAVVEREVWPRYLDGDLGREEALGQIVESLYP